MQPLDTDYGDCGSSTLDASKNNSTSVNWSTSWDVDDIGSVIGFAWQVTGDNPNASAWNHTWSTQLYTDDNWDSSTFTHSAGTGLYVIAVNPSPTVTVVVGSEDLCYSEGPYEEIET